MGRRITYGEKEIREGERMKEIRWEGWRERIEGKSEGVCLCRNRGREREEKTMNW